MITKELRKQLQLPLTKDLIYVPHCYEDVQRKPLKVLDINILYTYPTWYELEITLENGVKHMVHSGYFLNMQSPFFLSETKKDADKAGINDWFDW